MRIEIDSVLNQNRLGVCKHGLGTVRSVVAFRSNFIAVDFIDVGKNWSKALALFNFISSVISPTASPVVLKIPTLM